MQELDIRSESPAITDHPPMRVDICDSRPPSRSLNTGTYSDTMMTVYNTAVCIVLCREEDVAVYVRLLRVEE